MHALCGLMPVLALRSQDAQTTQLSNVLAGADVASGANGKTQLAQGVCPCWAPFRVLWPKQTSSAS